VTSYSIIDGLKPSGSLHITRLNIKNSTSCSLCFECFVRHSEQTATFPLYVINEFYITVVERVYSAVRADSLHKAGFYNCGGKCLQRGTD
jgi:hypothetical protein